MKKHKAVVIIGGRFGARVDERTQAVVDLLNEFGVPDPAWHTFDSAIERLAKHVRDMRAKSGV